LDEVWLIPQAQSADGKKLSPAPQRWRAVNAALKREVGLRAHDVDLRLGGVSRTVETLRQLFYEHGSSVEWTWLLGQDQALRLPQWSEAECLPALCRFSYFQRAGAPVVPKSIHTRFRCSALNVPSIEISSSWIRQQAQARMVADLAQAL
jgi:nicotinic acid mononucleotide adenylyltransferase